MPLLRRILTWVLTILLCNSIFFYALLPSPMPVKLCLMALLAAAFLWNCAKPVSKRGQADKAYLLAGGCELLLCIAACTVAQLVIYATILLAPNPFSLAQWVANSCVFFSLQAVMTGNALVRLFLSSGRLTASHRMRLVLLWWIPFVNLFIFYQIYRIAKGEHMEFLSAQG